GDADAVLRQSADIARRRLAALRELAYFGGHDGEAAAMLAGARRFDGGVQGEEVGLVGDLFDDGDLLGDRLHRVDGLANGGAALLRVARALGGHRLGLARVVGVLRDGGVHLLQAGGRFLHRGGLLAVAGGNGLRGGGDLAGGGGERGGGGAHLADDLHETADHAGERLAEGVAVGAHGDADAELSGGDARRGGDHLRVGVDHLLHRGEELRRLVAAAD